RELDVVGLGDGAADAAAIDVADLEILEEPAAPTFLDGAHAGSSRWLSCLVAFSAENRSPLLRKMLQRHGIMTILPKKSRDSISASASPSFASGNVRTYGLRSRPSAISTMPRLTSSLV